MIPRRQRRGPAFRAATLLAATPFLAALLLIALGTALAPAAPENGRDAAPGSAAKGTSPGAPDSSPGAPLPEVDVLTVDGAIQPITAEVMIQAIDRAERTKREALIIRLDTPGGLDTSMRDVIKRILVSSVPVVVYVAPAGSRAASAGTFIAMAAHVAAMAPGTSIGAATPVNLGGGGGDTTITDLSRKARNDAASYIRSLAAQRGRNAAWAERAVLEGGSVNETEALQLKVIELVARDDDDLFRQLDGRKVTVAGGAVTLHTKDALRHALKPSWRQSLLSKIVDPNVAYILFMLGFYGLLFELSNPGSILPGVVGGICLILAFLAFQTLPINYAGVGLIVFAMILFIIDLKVQSHGLLAVGGVVALVLGSLLLIGGDGSVARLSISVIATTVGVTVLFFVFVLGAAFRAQRIKPSTGMEGLRGERGTALTEIAPLGRVFVHGEYWEAEASERIEQGAPIVVEQVEGMRLKVHRA